MNIAHTKLLTNPKVPLARGGGTINITKGTKLKHEGCCNNTTIPYISLFSGYEGIGLGLKRIFGRNLRTIAYCEREAFPCANLVDKIETGQLDAAPIFTDVHTFPWEQYAPFMAHGIVSFGFPCQPVSVAGKRRSTEDERWLFDVCADGFAIMGPGILFAENVEGLLSAKKPNGLPVIAHIFERLEEIGYKVEAGIFSASEVGAPQHRKRVFILAYDQNKRDHLWRFNVLQAQAGWESINSETWNCGNDEVAISSKPGLQNTELETIQPEGRRNERRATAKFCGSLWPARPGEPQYEWEEPRVFDGKLNPDWVESLQGVQHGWTQLSNALPGENRIDRLRLLGNGVVPATAEKAFITLINRIKKPGINREQVEIQMELF